MRRLFWWGLGFELGVGVHLLDHLRRGLAPFVAGGTLPFLIVGPLALFGVWRARRWGAALMAVVALGGLTFGVWEHLIHSGSDHVRTMPWPSTLLTLSTLGVAVPLAWISLRALGLGPLRLDRNRGA